MLDVHPPHHATTTWRDFLIHIATIVIGLLIAIGLEQTVEWVRHSHERNQLERDLVIEANNNIELMRLDYQYFNRVEVELAALRSEARGFRAHPASGPHPVDLHALTGRSADYFPDAPVWNTAKEGGLATLLPRREAAMYDLVYGQQSLMTAEYHTYEQERAALENFSLRFMADPSQLIDLASMSSDDLKEYSVLLANLQSEMTRFRRATDLAQDVTQQAARGETNDQQAFKKIGVSKRH